MTNRQQKLPLALRITAAGCIGLWLLAVSCCNIGYLCSDDHHAKADAPEIVAHQESDHSQEAEAAEHAPVKTSHPHDPEQPSRDSHPHNGGSDSCCSTLMATAQIGTPFIIAQPLFQPLNFLCTVLQAQNPMPAAPEAKLMRQAKDRDVVLTPVVCLGPAHRSLAPPSPA